VNSHQEHPTAFDQVVQLLAEYGFDGMAQAMQMLMNEAMKIERNEVLNAAPYERCSDRRGYANGYKPKTVNTRIGSLELAVPQTRNIEFYPCAVSGP
jgi:transposase-like protein